MPGRAGGRSKLACADRFRRRDRVLLEMPAPRRAASADAAALSERRRRGPTSARTVARSGESLIAARLERVLLGNESCRMPSDAPSAHGNAHYDVAVVGGGGAAGLSAALVLGRARRQVAVIDAGSARNAPAARMQGFLSRDGLASCSPWARGGRGVRRRDRPSGSVGEILSEGDSGFRVSLRDGHSHRRAAAPRRDRARDPGHPRVSRAVGSRCSSLPVLSTASRSGIGRSACSAARRSRPPVRADRPPVAG